MKTMKMLGVVCLLLLTAVVVGCDTTRPGVTQQFTGEFTRYYPASGAEVHAATQRVMSKLELMPVSDTFRGTSGKVTGRNFQNTKVIVHISEKSPESTRVALLVDPGRNEPFSIRLLQMINEELGR